MVSITVDTLLDSGYGVMAFVVCKALGLGHGPLLPASRMLTNHHRADTLTVGLELVRGSFQFSLFSVFPMFFEIFLGYI